MSNEKLPPGADGEALETNYADKIAFLKERLRYHIKDYKERRDQSRWRSNAYKISVIILGALVTILLGIKAYLKADESLTILALILSTVVTAMTSWETFADYRGKWIRERSVLVMLYDIRDDLRYALAGNQQLSDEKTNQFYERLRLALSQMNEQWMSTRAPTIAGAPADKPHREGA